MWYRAVPYGTCSRNFSNSCGVDTEWWRSAMVQSIRPWCQKSDECSGFQHWLPSILGWHGIPKLGALPGLTWTGTWEEDWHSAARVLACIKSTSPDLTSWEADSAGSHICISWWCRFPHGIVCIVVDFFSLDFTHHTSKMDHHLYVGQRISHLLRNACDF